MTPAPGTVLFSRFRVIGEAGRGGMGVVLRATDQATGEDVALKLLLDVEGAERFVRESQTLAEIGHPGIVRYVAHGRAETGAPWLAMEWLEGESLSERLRRGPLPLRLAVTIAEDVARALGAAHAAGVVHRDVKPGNVFLAGERDAPRVKVLDFGIARRARADQRSLTTTGTVLGTPYYMAPEQARSDRALDARADVWSLGAVLYEMLTGHRPFEHDSVVAVLAAVLLEEPVPLAERLPTAPPALAALVHRCLDKRPEGRPEGGEALAGALAAIDLGARSDAPPRLGITDREQRVVFAVLSLHAAGGSDATVSDAGWSTSEAAQSPEGALRAAAEGHEAQVLPLGEGALLFVVPDAGTPADQAARAARLALALHAAVPTAALALAGGRAELGARLPVGEVVQRAEALAVHARADAASAVRIDELAASLVGPRFSVERDARGLLLAGERGDTTTGTRLDAPLVGRDRELRSLIDLASEAHDEPMAKVALVLGAPGAGKSRLLAELAATLEERSRVVSLRGEPLHSRSPHGLAAALVRACAGIAPGAPLAERRARLRAHLAEVVPPNELVRALALLGDITRTPLPPEEADPALMGALDDAFLRGDLVERAFTAWLSGQARRAPLSILVDDVHFVDEASLQLFDRALRACPDAPILLVLATREDGGELLSEREPVPVRLGRLAPKACRALLERILPGAPEALAARILERAEGNPLFLEEMARAARRGDPQQILPTSVLAVVEDRITELAPEARRVLRAIAILGARATASSVARVLGMVGDAERAAIDDWLAFLVRRELVVRELEGGEAHHRFRQPLVRDAAYAMLTERDRATGHLLAAELAEASEARDPDVIATHYDLAGEGERAAAAYAEAAERALGAHDLGGAIARAERGLALLGAAGSPVALLATQARAHRYRAEYAPAFDAAERALALDRPGSPAWLDAASTFVSAASQLGRVQGATPVIEALLGLPLEGPRDAATRRALIVTTCRAGSVLLATDRGASRTALSRAEVLLTGAGDEPLARAWCEVLAASHALLDGDASAFALGTERAVAAYERAGDARDACNQRVRLGNAWTSLGVPERAEPALEAARTDAARMGLRLVEGYALQNLGHARARLGRSDALTTLGSALSVAEALGDARLEAGVRLYLAELLRPTDPARAEQEAGLAWQRVHAVPGFGAVAAAHHALALLAIGQIEQAHARAEIATAALGAQPDAFEEGEASIRRAAIEVLAARGQHGASRIEARAAWARIEARAARIGDPGLRRSFLENVPDHRAIAAATA